MISLQKALLIALPALCLMACNSPKAEQQKQATAPEPVQEVPMEKAVVTAAETPTLSPQTTTRTQNPTQTQVPPQPPTPTLPQTQTVPTPPHFQDFVKQWEKPAQTFAVRADRDTVLTGKQGTRITLNANTLVDQKGKLATGLVNINLREFYSPADLLLAGLTTTSANELLETGGTILLTASWKGEYYGIQDGASIRLEFPTETEKPGMQLFEGIQQEDIVEWIPTTANDTNRSMAIETVEEVEGPAIFTIVEEMPQYPGGESALIADLNASMVYPKSARDQGLSGKVYVSFIVDIDGVVKNIRLARGTGTEMDRVAMDAVANLKRWQPGRQRDQAVPVSFTRPIEFKLRGSSQQKWAPTVPSDRNPYANYSPTADSMPMVDATFAADYTPAEYQLQSKFYRLLTTDLGWINCDRFSRTPQRKVDFAVVADAHNLVDVKLVFRDLRSIMRGRKEGDRWVFRRIPEGRNVRIVALGHRDSTNYLAIQDARVSRETFHGLKLEAVTEEELPERMSAIGKWK